MKRFPKLVTLAVAVVAAPVLSSCVVTGNPPTSPMPSTTTAAPTSDAPLSQTPSPMPSPAADSPSPTEIQPLDPKEYGDFPPVYLDELKTLSTPRFPEELLTYELSRFSEGSQDTSVNYMDDRYATLRAIVYFYDIPQYWKTIERLANPQYIGLAVCGNPATNLDIKMCVMAGELETLEVATASKQISLEEVGAFAQALYDVL